MKKTPEINSFRIGVLSKNKDNRIIIENIFSGTDEYGAYEHLFEKCVKADPLIQKECYKQVQMDKNAFINIDLSDLKTDSYTKGKIIESQKKIFEILQVNTNFIGIIVHFS